MEQTTTTATQQITAIVDRAHRTVTKQFATYLTRHLKLNASDVSRALDQFWGGNNLSGVSHTCSYVYKRGVKNGQICGVRIQDSNALCSKHRSTRTAGNTTKHELDEVILEADLLNLQDEPDEFWEDDEDDEEDDDDDDIEELT